MITARDILHALDQLAPRSLALEWDNCGLLAGDPEQPVSRVLVALDPFEGVCREAAEGKFDLILTHHPLIFTPRRSVTSEDEVGRCLRLLIQNNIAAINAHTNLDRADGGVNDVLARVLGLSDISAVDPDGMHLLRKGTVPKMDLADFLSQVKAALGCPGLRYSDGGRPVHNVCVGGGACGDTYQEAWEAGCDTLVTSDVKYNQFWDAKALGLNLIDAGHFYTENPVCLVLAELIRKAFPELTVVVSKKHQDCTNFF